MNASVTPCEAPVVLVVEDEPFLRWIAIDLLKEDGFDVLEANDAPSALQLLERHEDVRVLFTDIQMPGMSGMDLAREVHRRWPDIRLLLTSGRSQPTRAEIPDDGRFLSKPYNAGELKKQIHALAER
jgi:CheY-like chemotaxis protein